MPHPNCYPCCSCGGCTAGIHPDEFTIHVEGLVNGPNTCIYCEDANGDWVLPFRYCINDTDYYYQTFSGVLSCRREGIVPLYIELRVSWNSPTKVRKLWLWVDESTDNLFNRDGMYFILEETNKDDGFDCFAFNNLNIPVVQQANCINPPHVAIATVSA